MCFIIFNKGVFVMTKISAIDNIFVKRLKNINPKNRAALVSIPFAAATAGALSAVTTSPMIFSSQYKNFAKTVDEDNYFQLKINKETGKPYEADIFQKTSANHLYNNDDVVVTAPTGTGKTAIAEYIMTKNLKEGKSTYYTTPLKALSNEKFRDFSNIYGEENVGLLTGDTKINPDAPIVIMTTEVYRNMAIAQLFDNEKHFSENLKTVIFDELQYLGDIDRGGIWEQSIMFTPKNVQMLSLSATAKNAENINKWMGQIRGQQAQKAVCDGNYKPADFKKSVWVDVPAENRHVPLEIDIESIAPALGKKNSHKSSKSRASKKEAAKIAKTIFAQPDEGSYSKLTMKLLGEGKLPAIYFVFSKKESRNLLKSLAADNDLTTKEEKEEINRIIQSYIDKGKYLGVSLNTEALSRGFAIHNAGLLPTQKELVEELFQKKLVKVAIATETLSAGINMPARTTVISSPRKPSSTTDGAEDGKRDLTPNEFHQMAGRAGRRGIDTKGFCLPLSCNTAQSKAFETLKASTSNDLISNYKFDFSFIANYVANYKDDAKIHEIIGKTFYGFTNKYMRENLYSQFNTMKKILETNGFVTKNGNVTLKGELLKHVNGYEQIPIINAVADKDFAGLTPVELAGVVSALANVQYNHVTKYPLKPYELDNENENVVNITNKLANDFEKYSENMKSIYENTEIGLSSKVVNHVYEWAKLNSQSDISRENWHELCKGRLSDSIRDEGTVFKEIIMTIDLMKQMCDICDAGIYNSVGDEQNYYIKLKNNLRVGINLLQREPVDAEK